MKRASFPCLALACLSLAGCTAGAQVALDAALPAVSAVACAAVEKTAASQSACVNVAGLVVTVGEDIAAAVPAAAPAARKGK